MSFISLHQMIPQCAGWRTHSMAPFSRHRGRTQRIYLELAAFLSLLFPFFSETGVLKLNWMYPLKSRKWHPPKSCWLLILKLWYVTIQLKFLKMTINAKVPTYSKCEHLSVINLVIVLHFPPKYIILCLFWIKRKLKRFWDEWFFFRRDIILHWTASMSEMLCKEKLFLNSHQKQQHPPPVFYRLQKESKHILTDTLNQEHD